VLSQISGLPGAPVRVTQVTKNYLTSTEGAAISGIPPVFYLPLASYGVAPDMFPSAFIIGRVRSEAGVTMLDAARHTWLTTHLAALRAGHLTLAQVP
jgi:hypothetical protein